MIEITTDCANLRNFMRDLAASQVPFANAGMVNNLAFRARQAVYDEMDMVLDLPLKRYTTTSMRVRKGDKADTSAAVFLADDMDRVDTLGHLFRGGQRAWKNMEGALLRKGIIWPGYYAVPGKGAPLDRYGNIPASFIRSLLAYFEALNEGNMKAETRAKKARVGMVNGYKTIRGTQYFISFGRGDYTARYQRINKRTGKSYIEERTRYQSLPAGIYSKSGPHGVIVKPILMFVPKRKPYRRYINLPSLAERTVDAYASLYFNEALAKGIATSRAMRRFNQTING